MKRPPAFLRDPQRLRYWSQANEPDGDRHERLRQRAARGLRYVSCWPPTITQAAYREGRKEATEAQTIAACIRDASSAVAPLLLSRCWGGLRFATTDFHEVDDGLKLAG